MLRGKSPWHYIKTVSGAGNVSGGYTRKKRKISPLERKGQRLWLGYDALSATAPLKRLGTEVPSLVDLFRATSISAQGRRGKGGGVLAGNVLLQQILDDEGEVLPNYVESTRRVQAAHADGRCSGVVNLIVALHPNTSVLFYGDDGTATRVVLVKHGMSVAFLETTRHGGDSWLRSRKNVAHFSFRAFFSLALGRVTAGHARRSTASEASMQLVARDTQEAKRTRKAKRLKKNLKRRRKLTRRKGGGSG